MAKIYFAAPLHNKEDQERNAKYVALLRSEGHQVYLPQEHGIWEQFPDPQAARKTLYQMDLDAMRKADYCVACAGDNVIQREPSEGMLWEMGWMAAANKTVLLFNENNYWRYNLMPEFGSIMYEHFDDILDFLRNQESA